MLTAILLLSACPGDPGNAPASGWSAAASGPLPAAAMVLADWVHARAAAPDPAAEAPVLSGHTMLTDPVRFRRAGEAYFSPDMTRVIFQATERDEPEGAPYAMYAGDLSRNADGSFAPLTNIVRLSAPGSANTCGWWHPTWPGVVLFGTTTVPPAADEGGAGYQRGSGRYRWDFPREMEIVWGAVPIAGGAVDPASFSALFTEDGYDAEASWSPDGRHVLYTHVAASGERAGDGDLWILDTLDGSRRVLVAQPGYDGGPFFSPDGTRICYRSDRRGDNLLAVYAADLVRDERGSIVRIDNEVRLTFGEHVAWAPYFTSDGATLVFSSSQAGHDNYELFAVRSTLPRDSSEPSSVRVTHAAGFDGLGVVAPDGRHLMWTSQRGPKVEGEQRPSSQLWIARFDAGALAGALDAADAERALRERSRPAN